MGAWIHDVENKSTLVGKDRIAYVGSGSFRDTNVFYWGIQTKRSVKQEISMRSSGADFQYLERI